MKEAFTAVRADLFSRMGACAKQRRSGKDVDKTHVSCRRLCTHAARTIGPDCCYTAPYDARCFQKIWQLLLLNNWVVIYSGEVKYIVEHKVKYFCKDKKELCPGE